MKKQTDKEAEAPAMRAENVELAAAREHLAYWQPELRLDHLDIDLQLMRREERDELAYSSIAPFHHRQKLRIRHPEDRCPTDLRDMRRDLEVAVVHELLHMKESPWRDHPDVAKLLDEDKWLKQLHENSLDAVAEALVRARRGERR